MAYPGDTATQGQYLARTAVHVHASVESKARQEMSDQLARHPEGEELLVSIAGRSLTQAIAKLGGFAALAGAPSYEQAHDEILSAFWPGSVAAEILLNIYELHASGHEASVRKAVILVREYISDATTLSGKSLGSSTRFIQESWRRYKAVAHLWGAHRLWFFDGAETEEGLGDPDSPLCPFRVEGLPGFLALASVLLDFGVHHFPHGRSVPTLSPLDTWTLPKGMELPSATMTVSGLTPWKAEVLKNYKAEL